MTTKLPLKDMRAIWYEPLSGERRCVRKTSLGVALFSIRRNKCERHPRNLLSRFRQEHEVRAVATDLVWPVGERASCAATRSAKLSRA
jgi:hypothetical protein